MGAQIYASDERPGVVPARTDYILEDIAMAKRECECLVIWMHWGQEQVGYPTPGQRRQARKIISAAASLMIGHHPQVLQGVENLAGCLAAYSLGNFIFAEEEWTGSGGECTPFRAIYKLKEAVRRTAVWRANVAKDGNIVTHELAPVYLRSDLRPAHDARAERMTELKKRSAAPSRPFYALLRAIRMLGSRGRARAEEVFQGNGFWRGLHRLGPRHLRYAVRMIAREWEHLRGVK